MKRREFVYLSAIGTIGLSLPFYGCKNSENTSEEELTVYEVLVDNLLTTWADRMVELQIDQPDNPEIHGALGCPACNKIHGRCMDAVYPFMYMADKTGDKKYLNAAISVMNWSENVSMPDGSWTVIPDPNSWKGITVFGAIALGEALHHHGHILSEEIKEKWTDRLKKATEFIYQNFTMDYSHVNYAFTAVYALNFLGRFFENETYVNRSRELASEVPNWLTEPNKLIYGEDQPADKRSAKGLLPVDLGYNVEETLNGLVQYAFLEKDEELLQLLEKSMNSHLEFMLPDGAWDNSWGTRQNKWSYWGSRTTDGCQPAFSLMAQRNPAFGKAAILNTELLEKCTVNGLLAGGLHYGTHGVKPCVHHTFAHAKSLAFIMDNKEKVKKLDKKAILPREKENGITHFSELDVWLASKGSWKATISSYDNVFKKKYSQQATGGSLAVLWHEKVGPIFTASMAEYILVEANNQQPQPDGEDIPLTPRIECNENGKWYSNLFDLEAEVKTATTENDLRFEVAAHLTNRDREILDEKYHLTYLINKDATIIKATKPSGNFDSKLVLPIISATGEKVSQTKPNIIEIQKERGKIIIEANVPLSIMKTKKDRIFNMVPGFEAVPIVMKFPLNKNEIISKIYIEKTKENNTKV